MSPHDAAAGQQVDDADIMPAFEAWRQTLSRFTGLGLTAAAAADDGKVKELAEEGRRQKDCRKCEKYRDSVIAESPIVRFMLQHINSLPKPEYVQFPPAALHPTATEANSPVPIVCAPCGPDRGGGFIPNQGIILCQDRIFGRKHAEDTLAHELIHEWDHRRFNVDWANPRMVACGEIRAASLSGDCRWGREVRRRHYAFTKQHQECVKRRATLSLLQHVSMQPQTESDLQNKREEAARIVNEVWDSCWNDTRPFDEIY